MNQSKLYLWFLIVIVLSSGCVPKAKNIDAIAVWQHQETGDSDIWFSLWDDAAKRWWTDSGIAAPLANLNGDDLDPAIDSNDRKNAVAVWSHSDKTDSDIYFSRWSPNRWGEQAPVAELDGDDLDPSIAVGNDKTVAIWVHQENGQGAVYYSSFNGVEWGNPEAISTLGKASLPEVTFNPARNAFIAVWIEKNKAYYSILTDRGWTEPSAIPGQTREAVSDSQVPAVNRMGIDSDLNGNSGVVWAANNKIYGALWNGRFAIDATEFSSEIMPDSAFDNNNRLHSLYVRDDAIWYTKNPFSSLSTNLAANPEGSNLRPALIFLRSSIGLGIWWNNLVNGIYYSRYDGSWSEANLITENGSNKNPDIAALRARKPSGWCGNGVIDTYGFDGSTFIEECELGIPCQNPGDICFLCVCWLTKCGDGYINKPNSAGQNEDCDTGLGVDNCPKLTGDPNAYCKNCKCFIPTEPVEPECGNGVKEAGEECDDGNKVNEDGCSDECKIEKCDDGIVQTGLNEECDPPGSEPCLGLVDSYCNKDCKCIVRTLFCGDGYVHTNYEDCDPGNPSKGIPAVPCPPGQECVDCKCIMMYECVEDAECEDYDHCTKDTCSEGKCHHVEITDCISGDGCCPMHCTYETDKDCHPMM